MAWLAPPELAAGAEPALKPPELLELELLELEPELVPVELEPELPELELPELELLEPEFVLAEELDEVVWVDPGRTRARAPAVTTLATVTVVVVERTLARPRSLAVTAWRIPSSRRALLMSFILRSGFRESLHESSGRAMSLAGLPASPAEATYAT